MPSEEEYIEDLAGQAEEEGFDQYDGSAMLS